MACAFNVRIVKKSKLFLGACHAKSYFSLTRLNLIIIKM